MKSEMGEFEPDEMVAKMTLNSIPNLMDSSMDREVKVYEKNRIPYNDHYVP
jgi:hypothetical protein